MWWWPVVLLLALLVPVSGWWVPSGPAGPVRPVTVSYSLGGVSVASSGVAWYAPDGRGSVSGVADGAGGLVSSGRYDPWGVPAGVVSAGFGWNTEEYFPGAGLQYLRDRWVEPSSGRFLSADRVRGDTAQPGSLNRYGYAWGDPVNRADPSGLWPGWVDKAKAAVSSAVSTVKTAVGTAVSAVKTAAVTAVKAVGSAAVDAVRWVGANVVQPVTKAISTAAGWVGQNVVQPAVAWVNQNVVAPAKAMVSNAAAKVVQAGQAVAGIMYAGLALSTGMEINNMVEGLTPAGWLAYHS